MILDDIFNWILKNPINYPGIHQESVPRTIPSHKRLDSKTQFHIVLKATSEYIKQKVLDGEGVNLKGLGTFTYEEVVDDVSFNSRRNKADIILRFIPDQCLQYLLTNKQKVIHANHHGFSYFNASTIAVSCFLSTEVVQSIHLSLVNSIQDLTRLGRSLNIDFGFMKFQIINKNLKCIYGSKFLSKISQRSCQTNLKKEEFNEQQQFKTTYKNQSLNALFQRTD